ncbi:hypothetical protein BDV93DRAFT_523385 [Ceratobasidium sp. AG-I]|nr:hypothetical protein BDV93DRAFT_523385 [Ceratobasidium sp. AG-I]
MRSSKVFFMWIFLASTASCLRPVDRSNLDVGPRGALLHKRQDVSTTVDTTTPVPTETVTPDAATETASPDATTDVTTTSEPTATSSDLSTSDPPPTSTPEPTSAAPSPTSPTEGAGQTTSSVALLFTQSAVTSKTQTPTMAASSPTGISDTNVPFLKSKYHQMIIALACLSGALLIAMIALAIVALRARADVDLLHDRLSRYEQGFDLPYKNGEKGAGYGRLSMSDPDDMKSARSRRSTSESAINTLPLRQERRLSGTPMGSGTPPGNRRSVFGSEGNSPTSPDNAPVLPPIMSGSNKSSSSMLAQNQALAHVKQAIDGKSSSSINSSPSSSQVSFPSSQPGVPGNRVMRQGSGPRPNPGNRRVSLVDKGVVVPLGSPPQQVRRLPSAPAYNASYDTRSGPPAPN